MNQLKVLIPNRTFTTSQGAVTLAPFKFKQFKQILEIVEKYLTIFTTTETAGEIAKLLLAKSETDYTVLADISQLLKSVSPELEIIDDLQYDEVLALLIEIIDMNIDFFARMGKTLSLKTEPETPLPTILPEVNGTIGEPVLVG